MIPKVRTWRVTYYQTTSKPIVCEVQAPNKRFARWNARYIVGWSAVMEATKITVSVKKESIMKITHKEFLEDILLDLRNLGIGSDESIDGSDAVEYLNDLKIDLEKHFKRS